MTPPTEAFSDYDVEQNNEGNTFSIDDDDECEIESADEDSDDDSVDHTESMSKMFHDEPGVHDQLPSVEEVKASNAFMPTARLVAKGHRRKLYLIIAGAALAAMVLSVSITVGVFKRASKQKSHIDFVMETPKYDEVAQFIFSTGVSDLPSLRLSGTPESYACAFMSNGDAYGLSITNIDEAARRKFLERYVLVLMYYKSQGQKWENNYHFLTAIDHCQWHQQYSTPQGRFLRGVQCNKDGFVVDLDLSNNNLMSPDIPFEIDYLEHLERLHLYGNAIGGVLGQRLTNLKKLKSLGLMDLQLRGDIPSFLGEMTSLTTLALSGTKLGKTIPESFKNLRNLRVLGLDGMGLMGSIDPITKLSKLEALYLEDNHLSSWTEQLNWPSMKELDLSNNIFYNEIDAYLFDIQTLRVLDLNDNLFHGAFPEKFTENESIRYISMHNNKFSGSISDRIGFLKNLKHFDVAGNLLTGTLPDTIQLLTDLVSFSTAGNNFSRQRLSGDFFKPLTKLQDLSLKDNSFTGSIPGDLAALTNLRLLDLDRNELVGTIPTRFGQMKDLAILQLNRNMLTGTIPTELGGLKNIKILLLDSNHLTGQTSEICSESGPHFQHFTADCYPALNSEIGPEVKCRCCTLCCNDDTPDCNNHAWTSSYDPKSEYGYVRQAYTFSLDQVEEDWKEKVWEEAQAQTEQAPAPTVAPNPFNPEN